MVISGVIFTGDESVELCKIEFSIGVSSDGGVSCKSMNKG